MSLKGSVSISHTPPPPPTPTQAESVHPKWNLKLDLRPHRVYTLPRFSLGGVSFPQNPRPHPDSTDIDPPLFFPATPSLPSTPPTTRTFGEELSFLPEPIQGNDSGRQFGKCGF